MSRHTKRIKTSHDSTAAYAASQPLFDSLRTAVDRTAEQHAVLVKARDVVQQTHVKLADSIADGQQEDYIDSIIGAWRLATESFAEIFGELAKTTAAEPNEGRQAKEGHEAFVKMAEMATDAKDAAINFDMGGDSDGESQDSSQENIDPSAKTTSGLRKESMRSDKKGAQLKKRAELKRADHEKKLLALRAKMKQSQQAKSANGHKPDQQSEDGASEPVQYEDISAEVEARLKVKEAKREAAKKEKKRKRESGDSFGASDRKKKRSDAAGTGTQDDGQGVFAVKEKRKSELHADQGSGESRRKKARTKS